MGKKEPNSSGEQVRDKHTRSSKVSRRIMLSNKHKEEGEEKKDRKSRGKADRKKGKKPTGKKDKEVGKEDVKRTEQMTPRQVH